MDQQQLSDVSCRQQQQQQQQQQRQQQRLAQLDSVPCGCSSAYENYDVPRTLAVKVTSPDTEAN